MADGKKTFIFYSDWINMVSEMPDADAGELLKHILKYVNDKNPVTDNLLVKMAFGHMKPMLKEDLDKWEEIREKRRLAGAKGGKANAKQNEANAKQVQAVNDNDNVLYNNKAPKPSNIERYSFDESKETPSNDEIKNIEVKYSEINLLEDWAKCRKHFLKQPTGIKKLTHYEQTYFNNAKKTFTVEEIKEAMKCHFMQENKTIKSMYLRPSHFLEHIEKYHTASVAKEYQLYGSDKVKTAL